MNMARIIGCVVSTCKDEGLSGHKLLILQPVDAKEEVAGKPFVSIDSIGAGAGERVIYVRGREAAHAFLPENAPSSDRFPRARAPITLLRHSSVDLTENDVLRANHSNNIRKHVPFNHL